MAKVSSVRFFPTNGNSKVKANVSIVIDEAICASGFRIVDGKDGLFVGWPSEKGNDDQRYDTLYAMSKEIRQEFDDAILAEFKKSQG